MVRHSWTSADDLKQKHTQRVRRKKRKKLAEKQHTNTRRYTGWSD